MLLRPVVLAALLLPGLPAAAQEAPGAPICLAQREGMAACFGDKLCLCRYEPGGTLTGRPPGYRWDCGVLRPNCGVVPPDTGAGNVPLPLPSLLLQPQLPGRPEAGWEGQDRLLPPGWGAGRR